MKRLLCIVFAFLLLGGCKPIASEESVDSHEQPRQIRMTFPVSMGSDIEGLPEVEDAVNDITIPEIGVEVELVPVSAIEAPSIYAENIAKDVPMDLMVLNNENILNYVNQNRLLPLDDLLSQNGEGILEISEEYTPLMEGTTVKDKAYGVRIPDTTVGVCGGFWIDPALLKEVSFHYEPEKVYSLEELDVLLGRLKEAYPDAYPLGQITSNYDFSTSSFFLGVDSDGISSTDPCVLLLDSDSTQLVNYYETDLYYEWLTYMRKWYLDGYIYPDSAITTATSVGLYQAGILLSMVQIGSPYMFSEEMLGTELVPLRLSSIRQPRLGNTGVFWTMPVTSREPEAAMEFLNMMYTDERIINLLSWGIKERDYTLTESGDPVFLDSCCFVNPLGIFGDQRKRYEKDYEERRKVLDAFAQKAEFVNPAYNGFTFDTSELVQELLEIEQVKSQYLRLLESGCVDLDSAYPEFIQSLYDAGLQRVMDEKQRQFDEWLAKNPS